MTEEDSAFKRRLDEINQEMMDILGSQRRPEVVESPVDPQPPITFASSGTSHMPRSHQELRRPPHVSAQQHCDPIRPLITTSTDILKREVHSALFHEMRHFEDHAKELVSREWDLRLKELDMTLRGRFSELRSANDQLSSAVLDLSSVVESRFKDVHDRLNEIEAEQKRKMMALEQECRAAQREVQRVRDLIVELQEGVSGDGRTLDKRVDEISKRSSEMLRQSLQTIDEKLHAVHSAAEVQLRESRKRYEEEITSLERHVARLHGALEGKTSLLEKLVEQVTVMADDAMTTKSELRSCRADVNRVELVQRTGSRELYDNKPVRGRQYDPLPMPLPLADISRMQHDIFTLKESVAYLSHVLDDIQEEHRPMRSERPREDVDRPRREVSRAAKLERPPYIASSRSPTKAQVARASALMSGATDSTSRPPLDSSLTRELSGSSYVSEKSPLSNAGQYRTVPDSDTDEEYENSKLARSELD
jgi:hypothetical protein